MRFDDRLSTVLGLSAEAPRERAVQWRQLVELVARGAGSTDPALFSRALERIEALRADVPDAVRAVAARAIAGGRPPVALVALFVDRTEIAAPLLATADFDAAQWEEIRSRASPEVRELMDLIRRHEADEPEHLGTPLDEGHAPAPAPEEREQEDEQGPALFRWECGPTGEIDWVEGAPRAALIGRSVADDFHQRFAARLPFSDEPLVLASEGLLAGEWKWSGTPAFFPDTGRFAGYHGSARRGDGGGDLEAGAATDTLDSNRLRELIHELRTPLTAIIGFGEIIEGQILGPAHRAYRNRAAEIVRQARRLLAAVDDLDLAAKLRSGKWKSGEGTPVSEILSAVVADLPSGVAQGKLQFQLRSEAADLRVQLDRNLSERLLRKFIGGVVGAASDAEVLTITAARAGDQVSIALDLPNDLRSMSEEQLLDPAFTGKDELGLGIGFALRLARGLAAIAGGSLHVRTHEVVLRLPTA